MSAIESELATDLGFERTSKMCQLREIEKRRLNPTYKTSPITRTGYFICGVGIIRHLESKHKNFK